MDSSVVATKYPGVYVLSTTDYFYPSVEDPILQGRIACCNVVSDLYAMGVTEIDTMLMLLTVCTEMPQVERDIVTAAMMRGFVDCATEAGTSVTGGQTVLGPWPTLGGVATSLRHESEFLRPENIAPGDVLVLTKPLGTQLAVNLWQWRAKPERWARVEAVATLELAAEAYDAACESMGRLNLNAARCMHTYGAHGGTDVTGFGILGHARNWAQHAAQRVHVTLTALPIIRGMVALDDALSGNFKLRAGLSPETSGGLLIALPTREAAAAFIEGVRAADGQPAWVVGHVSAALPGKNSDADVSADVTIIEV